MSPQNGSLRISLSVILQSVASVLLVGMIFGGINLHSKVSAMEKMTETTSEDHDKIIKIEKDVEHIKGDVAEIRKAQEAALQQVLEKLDEMQRQNGGGPR